MEFGMEVVLKDTHKFCRATQIEFYKVIAAPVFVYGS
jgi:hypothetical protein